MDKTKKESDNCERNGKRVSAMESWTVKNSKKHAKSFPKKRRTTWKQSLIKTCLRKLVQEIITIIQLRWHKSGGKLIKSSLIIFFKSGTKKNSEEIKEIF